MCKLQAKIGKLICGGAALVVFGGGANFNVWGLSPPKPFLALAPVHRPAHGVSRPCRPALHWPRGHFLKLALTCTPDRLGFISAETSKVKIAWSTYPNASMYATCAYN